MRVLIVDSHPLFAEILGIHITASYPQVSIFEAHSIAEAIAVLGAYQRFELILLDFALAGSQEHFAGVCQIKIKTPLTPLVILADIEHTTGIMDAMTYGVNGYITKSVNSHELKNALSLLLKGESYMSPALLIGHELSKPKPYSPLETMEKNDLPLTPRQLQVCQLLTSGLPNKLIAKQLSCSEGTIRLHVSAVLKALKVKNRTEAARMALRLGIGR